MPDKNSKIFFSGIIMWAVLFAALVLATEGIVRVCCPDLVCWKTNKNYFEANKFGTTYGFKANIDGILFNKKFFTDERGFSTKDAAARPAESKGPAILVLGDSVSCSVGVEAKESYPFLLEKRLKNHSIINTSCMGYWIKDYADVLEYSAERLDFEGVIVNICLNDFVPASQQMIRSYLDNTGKAGNLVANPIGRFFIYLNDSIFNLNSFMRSHSSLYLLLRGIFYDTSKVGFLVEGSEYDRSQTREAIREGLASLKNLAEKKHKWIIFFVLPFEYQLRQSYSIDDGDILKPQRTIAGIAGKESVLLVDLYPGFKRYLSETGTKSSKLYLSYDPMHFSPKGHRVLSDIVYDELSKHGLVKDAE